MRKVGLGVLVLVLFVPNALSFAVEDELGSVIDELADRLAFANEGYVRAVSGDTVYIDLGQAAGIWEGTRFEVVRLGEPILSEGKIIGYQEEIIGEIEVTRVRKEMSIAKIMSQTKDIQEGDKVYQLTKRLEGIAITEFPYGEQFNDLTRDIEDRLYTAIVQRGLQVMERKRLAEVLEEQAAEWTGIFDLATAAEFGKLLGVEGVLIGNLSDQAETLLITARLVDVETAQVVAAAAVNLRKTPKILEALGSGVRAKPSVIWKKETTELPQGRTVFFDDFTIRPNEQWNITDGKWTVIEGRFTALERGTGKWYEATLELGKMPAYVIEADVWIGKSGDNCGTGTCYTRIITYLEENHSVMIYLYGADKTHGIEAYIGSYLAAKKEFEADNPVHVRIEAERGFYKVYLNNKKLTDFFDPDCQPEAVISVGLGIHYGTRGCSGAWVANRAFFDNFRVEVP